MNDAKERRALFLQWALAKCDDLDTAFAWVLRMEKFVATGDVRATLRPVKPAAPVEDAASNEIAARLARGETDKEIAKALFEAQTG